MSNIRPEDRGWVLFTIFQILQLTVLAGYLVFWVMRDNVSPEDILFRVDELSLEVQSEHRLLRNALLTTRDDVDAHFTRIGEITVSVRDVERELLKNRSIIEACHERSTQNEVLIQSLLKNQWTRQDQITFWQELLKVNPTFHVPKVNANEDGGTSTPIVDKEKNDG